MVRIYADLGHFCDLILGLISAMVETINPCGANAFVCDPEPQQTIHWLKLVAI